MNAFDSAVILWLNQFARRSELFDRTMVYVVNAQALKGGFIMVVFWWLWFFPRERRERIREIIAATMAAACAAIFIGRALASFLPFRLRPEFNPALGFRLPFGSVPEESFRPWSAFPRDHALLF